MDWMKSIWRRWRSRVRRLAGEVAEGGILDGAAEGPMAVPW